MHIPTDKDDDVKLYLCMRDDHKLDLKKTKQRIHAFYLSQEFHYDKEMDAGALKVAEIA